MRQALIATIFFCFFYSLQIVVQQQFVRTAINPLHLNFLTNLLASIILTLYFSVFNRKAFILKPDRKTLPFFITALLSWILADFFAIYGLKLSTSINYSILSRTMIFFVFILSVIFLQEKINLNKILATAISFIGGILVIYNFQAKFIFNLGDLFFLITVLALSISSIARQKIGEKLSVIQLTYLLMTYAAVILGVISFIFFPLQNIGSFKFIVFNSLFGLIGFLLVNYAIQKGGAVFFTLVANLLPVFTIIFSFLILKQLPVLSQIIGGILIIFGIFLFQRKGANTLSFKFFKKCGY